MNWCGEFIVKFVSLKKIRMIVLEVGTESISAEYQLHWGLNNSKYRFLEG